ncbi:MAG: YveK family protein [Thermoleophilia bacterium]
MDLVDFISVIRRWIWLLIPVVLLVVGYTAYSGIRSQTAYNSEATIVIGLSQIAASSTGGFSIANSGDRIGATYSELVTARPVMEKALAKAGLDWHPDTLRSKVSTNVTKNTPVFKVDVVDTDPQRTQTLANAVAESFVEYIQDVSTSGADDARKVVMGELTRVDTELASARAANSGANEARINSLQDSKATILKQYATLLDQQTHAGDIRVANPADSSTRTGTSLGQRIAIGLAAGLIVGILLEFIAEAISGAVGTVENDEY